MSSAETQPEPAAGADRGEMPVGAAGEPNAAHGAAAVGDDRTDGAFEDEYDMSGGASGESLGVPVRATRTRINITRLAVGGALIAGDQIRDGVRSVSDRAAAVVFGLYAKTREQTERAKDKLFDTMDDADRRGRDSIEARRHDATTLVNTTLEDAMAWAQVKVMPQFIDDLVPHLISDVVPRLIDGAMPEIRDRVIPVIIGDLTTDARVQELILAQSRGVLGQLAEQLRTNTTRADDRLEAAAHRVVGRTDRGTPTKGVNEIRGV